jgi:hypothetical protein
MFADTVSRIPETDRADRLAKRLAGARRAFTTRHVDVSAASRLIRNGVRPRAGDVVLARIDTIGQHGRLENIHGRRGTLYPGDEILVAFGNRYAPDQFEAFVPEQLGPCDLVAGGGVASQMTVKHADMKAPTRINTIGLLAREDGGILNLGDFAAAEAVDGPRPAITIAVVGSSMNAGKTTTAAGLVRGLTLAGFRVGAAKITGTGSGGDLWTMLDAGAAVACDFSDAGHASTFCLKADQLEQVANRLMTRLGTEGIDIAIVEIADGLLQPETAAIINIATQKGWFDGFVFAAADAMGAAFGVDWLARMGVAASPLAAREAAAVTGCNVATLSDLRDPVEATKLVFAERGAVRAAA